MNKSLTLAAALTFSLAAGPAMSDHTANPAQDTTLEQVEHGNVNLGGSDAPATTRNPTGNAGDVRGLKAFHKGSHDVYGGAPGKKGDKGDYVTTMERAMQGHDMGYEVPKEGHSGH